LSAWNTTHALVNVRHPLDNRSRANVALQGFLAGGANSFWQCQFSGARETPDGLRRGFVLDVKRHWCSLWPQCIIGTQISDILDKT